MIGLTPLGTLHTAIGIVAVAAGLISFFKHQEISPGTSLGKIYLWTTVLTCITSFGIFQHGGFGVPHALGVLTLFVLALATAADRGALFGRLAPYVATVGYSLTFFFHMIPGITETFTRVPLGSPLFDSPEDPALKATVSVFFLMFLAGATWQVRHVQTLRRMHGGRLMGRA